MDAEFWTKAWNEGRTNFHQPTYHEKLVKYFPRLNPEAGQSVLVPLCGKSKDLLWLHQLGLHVHGVELHAQAVEDFFSENRLQPVQKNQDSNFKCYAYQNILIRCGDFFKLGKTDAYDLIYDRGALVALPETMRQDYARVVQQALKKGGKYLLIVYEYDPSKMDGPPFSIQDSEIQKLYGDRFKIDLIESQKPDREGARLAAVEDLKQKIYILEKN